VDAVAKALARFEADIKFGDFKAFHFEQAIAFKKRLSEQDSKTTGEKLNKATLHATLAHLKWFFQWLAGQPRYKSRLRYSDAGYFNRSRKGHAHCDGVARKELSGLGANQERPCEDAERLRDRASKSCPFAFTFLTGARDRAIASMRLKHVDLATGSVY
jgi:integrase/recombinase XerD